MPGQTLAATKFADLAEREREIREMVAAGYRNANIARRLVAEAEYRTPLCLEHLAKLQVRERGHAIQPTVTAGPPAGSSVGRWPRRVESRTGPSAGSTIDERNSALGCVSNRASPAVGRSRRLPRSECERGAEPVSSASLVAGT